MWAHDVGPWVGEPKPLGKTPFVGNPSPEMTYLTTFIQCAIMRAKSNAHRATPLFPFFCIGNVVSRFEGTPKSGPRAFCCTPERPQTEC